MSELFEDVDEELPIEIEEEEVVQDHYQASPSEARRKLEQILAEKKLRDELEDFFDDIDP